MEVALSTRTGETPELHTDLCGICLITINDVSFGNGCHQRNKKVALINSCLHVFCEECIRNWTQTCDCCPVCNKAIDAFWSGDGRMVSAVESLQKLGTAEHHYPLTRFLHKESIIFENGTRNGPGDKMLLAHYATEKDNAAANVMLELARSPVYTKRNRPRGWLSGCE